MAKNKGGRPAFYTSAERLQRKIDAYFKDCPDYITIKEYDGKNGCFVEYNKTTPTVSGLVKFLGFSDRKSFYEYENKPEFTHTIKNARTRIANEYEKQLYNKSCTGAIFALKNLGWKDTAEVTHNAGEDIREKYLKSLENMYADKVGEQQIQSESKEVPEQKA